MKNLFVIAALFFTNLVSGNEANHQFTPNHKIISRGKTIVYFVTQNPEKYDWVKWDFGDGKTEYSINPAHEYTAVGVYHVKMIVSKGSQVDTICKMEFVTILEKNSDEREQNDYTYQSDNLHQMNNLKANAEKKPTIGFSMENNNLIICNENLLKCSIEIRDLNGNITYTSTINEGNAITNIDVSFMKQGMYVVYLKNGQDTLVSKFLKP